MIQIEIEVSDTIKKRLEERAEKLGISVNELIRNIIVLSKVPKGLPLRTTYELYKGYCKLFNIEPMRYEEIKNDYKSKSIR